LMTTLLATLTPLALVLPTAPLRPVLLTAPRCGPIVAFDDGQQEQTLSKLWQKTESGMSYMDVSTPATSDAAAPNDGQLVAVRYTASYVSSGQVVDSTGERPFAIRLGDDSEPFFQEAMAGMKVGGTRKLRLEAGSKFAAAETGDEMIEFELELVSIPTGLEALRFQLVQNQGAIINAAILLSFAPDILNFLGLLRGADPAAQLNAAFDASGFGAVDILSSAATTAPILADAANQWAVQGLQGLF